MATPGRGGCELGGRGTEGSWRARGRAGKGGPGPPDELGSSGVCWRGSGREGGRLQQLSQQGHLKAGLGFISVPLKPHWACFTLPSSPA